MEEGPILVVGKRIVDFLVPDDAAIGRRDIDEFEPEGVADQVIGKNGSTLETSIGPSLTIGVGNVEFGDGDGVDLIRGLWNCPLDRLFVVV